MKILVVEDDLTIQKQLKNLLSGNGYEVDTATDFSNVIEQVKAFAPHLVLLDIQRRKPVLFRASYIKAKYHQQGHDANQRNACTCYLPVYRCPDFDWLGLWLSGYTVNV